MRQESKFLPFYLWAWIQFQQDKDRFLMQLMLSHQYIGKSSKDQKFHASAVLFEKKERKKHRH